MRIIEKIVASVAPGKNKKEREPDESGKQLQSSLQELKMIVDRLSSPMFNQQLASKLENLERGLSEVKGLIEQSISEMAQLKSLAVSREGIDRPETKSEIAIAKSDKSGQAYNEEGLLKFYGEALLDSQVLTKFENETHFVRFGLSNAIELRQNKTATPRYGRISSGNLIAVDRNASSVFGFPYPRLVAIEESDKEMAGCFEIRRDLNISHASSFVALKAAVFTISGNEFVLESKGQVLI